MIVLWVVALITRLLWLQQLPPSPYWEEVALGYDAWSIAETARDHHGNFLPLVAFESFGDWKPALYIYAVVPFVKILGLSVIAVRLPAAISGLFVLGAILAFAKLLRKKYLPDFSTLPIWSLLVGVTMPWLVLFSRGGWEVMLGTALITWSIVFWLRSYTTKKINFYSLLLSVLLLSLSMYAYHGFRLTAPLLGIGLLVHLLLTVPISFGKFLNKHVRVASIITVFVFAMVLPHIQQLNSSEYTKRYQQTKFDTVPLVEQSNEVIQTYNGSLPIRLLHHRYWYYAGAVLENVFDHTDLDFLFLTGDTNHRHSTQLFGQLLVATLPFLLLGLYALFATYKEKNLPFIILISWWWLAVHVPVALTKTTPHALRTLAVAPLYAVLIGVGIAFFIKQTKEFIIKNSYLQKRADMLKNIMIVLIGSMIAVNFFVFSWHYIRVYPQQTQSEWQYGYKEMIHKVLEYQQTHQRDTIAISRENGRPAMYYWFYSNTPPQAVQDFADKTTYDQGEFLTYDQLIFSNDFAGIKPDLVVATPDEWDSLTTQYETTQINNVSSLENTEPVWILGKVAW